MTEESWRDREIPFKIAETGEPLIMENELTGPKDSLGKPDWSILPLDAVEFIIPAFEWGKQHYGDKNTFRKGILHGKLIAATIRHLIDWYWRKEENAPDSNVHHLAHAGANILMIISNLHRKDCNDR